MTFTVLPGQICITCTFYDLAAIAGCLGVITTKDVGFQAVFTINTSDDSHTKCLSDFPHGPGVYQLTIHDTDNNGEVYPFPAFTYCNISILGIGL